MDEWKRARKLWSEARDAQGVKRGAVSGVSMGDAIDKIAKSAEKGYRPLLAAIAALDKDLKKYKSKIAKDAPKLVKWIDSNIAADLDKLEKGAKADLVTLAEIIKDSRDTVFTPASLNPDTADYKKVLEVMSGDSTLSFQAAANKLGSFTVQKKTHPVLKKRGAGLIKQTWKVSLLGRGQDYTTIKKYGQALVSDAEYCTDWIAVKKPLDFLERLKGWRSRQTFMDTHTEFSQALVALLGK